MKHVVNTAMGAAMGIDADKLKEAGMQVNEDVDRDDIKNAMMPAIEEFLKSQPGDLWTTYQAIYDLSNS